MYVYALALIQDYVSQENTWNLNGNTYQSNVQLLLHSLGIYIRKLIHISTYFQIFRSQKGSVEALNLPLDYIIIT